MPIEPQTNGPRPEVELSIGIWNGAVSAVVRSRDSAPVCDIVCVETEVILLDLRPRTQIESTFAGRVLNTAPIDPALELSCPAPASRNGPHYALRFLKVCGHIESNRAG